MVDDDLGVDWPGRYTIGKDPSLKGLAGMITFFDSMIFDNLAVRELCRGGC